ncbi:energy transducer TonB [uncultured Flavobacterium sp.]|uniref:energy transducer TonB n=1 Tax=uncultured Flavobacterium sp. TaxID=165435 RepID=UPI0030C7F5B0
MKKLILFVFLAFCSISFAQDEIKYKTAFENVEQNCDSIHFLKYCYLNRFQLVVNRKFTEEIILNKKLAKNINDNIYLEIEVDTTGKFVIHKISTKSKDFEKSLKKLVELLPKIEPFKNEKNNKIKLEAILEFNLKEVDFDHYILPDNKKDLTNMETPRFQICKSIIDEKSGKECFMSQMNNHIRQNFNYPIKAINRNISGRAMGNFVINKEGLTTNFIIYGANPILLKETLRILKLLPTFIPGKLNGKDISVSYAQPIVFKLN